MSQNNTEPNLAPPDTVTDTNLTALELLMSSISGSLLSQIVFYLYPIISVWIVVANCLTLYVYAKFKRLHKKRNVMLISLSAVDLFTGLTQMMPKLIGRLVGADKNFAICMAASALQIAPAWASIFHLVSIAIERHIAITKPLMYHVIVTPKRLAIAVGTNLGVAGFFALIPLAWPWEEFPELCMSILWYPKPYRYIFVILPMAGSLVLIFLLYLHIHSIARKQERAIAANDPNNTSSRESGSHKESRATQIFILICGIALACYVPFWIGMVLILALPNNVLVVYIYYITLICLHLNSGMNFIVYTFRNSEFRTKIKTLFRRRDEIQSEISTRGNI
ncbi:hypothetical protein LSH36_460g01002 [Paralvinella palmiformis]|uniref:G-protein coupled receptors family 1 profile domain-containing protein n=1 Tax=Paralvinella palmiformis TaxID=53620 RepID=A0AAD9J9R6_9ANNE|nr:hypothetical protein LSH36_460g01002 [Paralvinella palmiformis]